MTSSKAERCPKCRAPSKPECVCTWKLADAIQRWTPANYDQAADLAARVMAEATGTPAAWADLILADILADIERGIVPRGVADFARLHDYVDANMYLLNRMGSLIIDSASTPQADLANAITGLLSDRLAEIARYSD